MSTVGSSLKGRRYAMSLGTALVALTALVAVLASPAEASGYTTGGGPWNVRSCPTTDCGVIGQMPNGPIPDLICQVYGERVIIGTFVTSIWNKIETPSGTVGFITDAAVNETPGGIQFDANLPRCQGAHGGSVYFKPRDWWIFDPMPNADYIASKSNWSFGNCSTIYGGNYPDVIGGLRVSTLAGWSLGRLGPIYAMSYDFSRVAAQVDSIVLFDPGSYEEMTSPDSCDVEFDQSQLYAQWLAASPSNRLLILAGEVTKDREHPAPNGDFHQGIQQALFGKIRATSLASQVLVCNYDSLSHEAIINTFGKVMNWGPQSTCPTAPGVTLDASWHP